MWKKWVARVQAAPCSGSMLCSSCLDGCMVACCALFLLHAAHCTAEELAWLHVALCFACMLYVVPLNGCQAACCTLCVAALSTHATHSQVLPQHNGKAEGKPLGRRRAWSYRFGFSGAVADSGGSRWCNLRAVARAHLRSSHSWTLRR